MERDEALALLRRYVTSPSHIVHSHATAAIMRKAAEHLGEDVATWRSSAFCTTSTTTSSAEIRSGTVSRVTGF